MHHHTPYPLDKAEWSNALSLAGTDSEKDDGKETVKRPFLHLSGSRRGCAPGSKSRQLHQAKARESASLVIAMKY